jgi:monoamine oxidase
MAHTRLFGALKRWALLAWIAERQRRPTRECVEQISATWQTTRREVLRTVLGTTAMASLPLMSCTSSLRHHSSTKRVDIVGAGLAGLHAAYRLRQAGVRAQIYEASTRVGGRILTARDLYARGQVAELGGEFIDSNHIWCRSLAQEFRVPLDDLFAKKPPEVLRYTFFFQNRHIDEAEIVEAFRPIATHIEVDVDAAARNAATFCPGHALCMHWPSAPFALGSYAAYRPGQTAFEGIEGQQVGNLHFCGEHTSVIFQGLMEGAWATGAFVAQAALHDLGLPIEHIMPCPWDGASPLPT